MLILLLVGCKPKPSDSSEQSDTTMSQTEPSDSESRDSESSENSEEIDPFFEHKKIIESLKNFNVNDTNGFNYVLEQKVDDVVTNAHEIKLRVDWNEPVKAEKYDKTVRLNDKFTEDQFNIVEETIYFYNNQIGELVNGSWVWKNANLVDFIAINIGDFNFEIENMEDIVINEQGEKINLSFTVPSNEIYNVFGDNYEFQNILFYISVNKGQNTINELNLRYNQKLSFTTFNFAPFYGEVDIRIPV